MKTKDCSRRLFNELGFKDGVHYENPLCVYLCHRLTVRNGGIRLVDVDRRPGVSLRVPGVTPPGTI